MKSVGIAYEVSDYQNLSYLSPKMAPPGMLTSVQVFKKNMKRLPEPYANCFQSSGKVYNFHMCSEICITNGLLKQCNCSDGTLEDIEELKFNLCSSLHHSTTQMRKNFQCRSAKYTDI